MKSEMKGKSVMQSRADLHRIRSSEINIRGSRSPHQEFWAYESEKEESSKSEEAGKEKPLPDMLVRCVNEFSEWDKSEREK